MAYRAAIIGCGKIGSEFADDPHITDIYTHAGAYTACPDTNLVAVCDSDLDKVRRCGERWEMPHTFQNIHKMIDETHPEIISICTPDSTHHAVICEVMKHQCIRAIYAEKPLALSLVDATEILYLAKTRNVTLAVNYFRRYAPTIQNLRKEIIEDTCIGEIQTVSCYYTKGILHNGTHLLDLARFIIGDIVSVQGFRNRCSDSCDPTLDAYIQFENGASGYIHGCDEKQFDICEMDIIGSSGRIRIIDSGHTIERYEVRDDPHYSGYFGLFFKEKNTRGMTDTILHGVEDLVFCLNHKKIPQCSGYDGYIALKLGLAIRDSARTGNIIAIQNRII
jgi:predicted dehydrogenase